MNKAANLTAALSLLVTNAAFAATDTGQQPAGGSLLVGFAIVYLSRRRPIGGWLLYYYLQLYLSLPISLIFVPHVVSNLNPSKWDNSLLYVMFFLSVVPVLLVVAVEVFVATKLLLRRNEQNLKLLRRTLVALVVASGSAIIIDLAYFRDDLGIFFDALTGVFSITWALYFWKAHRVRSVFIDRNWAYTAKSITAEDKKKLRKRVFVVSSITFVLSLLLMGSTLKQEGRSPDAAIFAAPIYYALIAAVIAWYLPIRRKETNVTTDTSTTTVPNKHDT